MDVAEFLLKSYKGSKNGSNVISDPSVDMNAATYCMFVESMGTECLQSSILELWNYDPTRIRNLTKEGIIDKLNRAKEK